MTHSGVARSCGDEYYSEPQSLHHSEPMCNNSWCLVDRGVWYALLMRGNKPKTAVQSSTLLFHLVPHGVLHHVYDK